MSQSALKRPLWLHRHPNVRDCWHCVLRMNNGTVYVCGFSVAVLPGFTSARVPAHAYQPGSYVIVATVDPPFAETTLSLKLMVFAEGKRVTVEQCDASAPK